MSAESIARIKLKARGVTVPKPQTRKIHAPEICSVPYFVTDSQMASMKADPNTRLDFVEYLPEPTKDSPCLQVS